MRHDFVGERSRETYMKGTGDTEVGRPTVEGLECLSTRARCPTSMKPIYTRRGHAEARKRQLRATGARVVCWRVEGSATANHWTPYRKMKDR